MQLFNLKRRREQDAEHRRCHDHVDQSVDATGSTSNLIGAMMSTFYVLSYLAFCLPSLLVGSLTRTFGLIAATDGYGAVLIVLSLGALLALMRQRPAKLYGATGSLYVPMLIDGESSD